MKTHYFFALLIGISFTSLLNAQLQIGNKIFGESAGDLSGNSVSMGDNRTVAIGAAWNDFSGTGSGHARVYEWSGITWVQKGTDLEGDANNDRFGQCVSMSDKNTLAISSTTNSAFKGYVKIFRWDGNMWVQKGINITGISGHDFFGWSISMPDSNTIAIGATGSNFSSSNYNGRVNIYKWDGISWVQKGTSLFGVAINDRSGTSVSMPDSNVVAISASRNDSNGTNSGHVRIYKWNGSTWLQLGADIFGEAPGDELGASVSMPDSLTVAIGASMNDGNGSNSGHVRVYNWNGTSWIQKGIDINGEAAGDLSGGSISMSDSNTIAIGASGNRGNGFDAGQVRIYKWNGTAWIQKGIDYEGDGIKDFLGISVSMSDTNTFATGAHELDGSRIDTGYVKVFSLCNTANIIVTKACNSYLSPSGNYTWINSGTYIDTIPNSQNCDSIMTINLTITPIVLTVSNFSTSLASNEFGAGYQWVDCDSNYAPIFGANSQFFLPPRSGNYAVILSKNGCVDTSACENVTIVGMLENAFNKARVYPNPTDGAFTIDLGAQNQEVDLRVNSIDGQLVFQKNKVNSNQFSIDLSNQPKGVYFITLQNKDAISIIKLVRD